MHSGFDWFRSQLAVAQWNLDAAVSAPATLARLHLQRADQTYRELVRELPDSRMTEEHRAEIQRGLEEIGARLQIDGVDN